MSIRERAFAVTDVLRARIIPELRYAQTQYEEHVRHHATRAQCWLDVGCGHHLLPPWRAEAEAALIGSVGQVVGIDYDLDALRRHANIRDVCRADVGALPFADESFDLVTANMVVEHLDAPVAQFREIRRVLRPDGVFLFHTPNARSYPVLISKLLPDSLKKPLVRVLENRASEDVYPTHYRANTERAIHEAAAQADLEAVVNFTASTPALGAIPPLAAFELLVLRQLVRRAAFAKYRQTLICALRRSRPPAVAVSSHDSSSAAESPSR